MKYNFELDMVYNNSLSLIAKQIKKESVVLEFGPANGRLTKYMKGNLECQVYLVEIDEVAGHEALKYAEDLLVDDIENFLWLDRYADIKFDYIIFADVLEHLHNPEHVLMKSKLLLKETGAVLLSVPNIGHNSVIINLVNNRFEYTDIGLLDNTHIHFFTKNSLERMILEAGFIPAKRMATYNEVGDNEIKNTYADAMGIDESFWKTREYGCVYQYVYELKTGKEYITEKVNNVMRFLPIYLITFVFDTGMGFLEDNYVQYQLCEWNLMIKKKVSLPVNIKALKVRLINCNCVVEDVRACVVSGEQNVELQYKKSNLDALEGGQYYFFSDTPEICYEIPEDRKYDEFEISLNYVTLNKKEINLLYNTMIKVKNSMTNEV